MTTFSHIVCLHAKATVEPSSYFIQLLLCLRMTSIVIDRINPQNNSEDKLIRNYVRRTVFIARNLSSLYLQDLYLSRQPFLLENGLPVFGIVFSKKKQK